MIHRPTFVSKYSSQGLSQQLSNLQLRRAFKQKTFINGGNLQPAEFNTKYSCKIALAMGYRLHSLVHLLHRLVTECTDQYWLHSLYTLASTTSYRVYRPVPATQPCTLASTTGYRVYRPVPAIQPCTLLLAIGYIWLQPTGYKSTGRALATQSLLCCFSPN